MQSTYTLKIPCRAHVYQYLIEKFPQPYILSEIDYEGIFLIEMLRKPLHKESYRHHLEMKHYFIVEISPNQAFSRYVRPISGYGAYRFNQMVHQFILHSFTEMMRDRSKFFKSDRQAIFHFLERYNFDESGEINYASLAKHLYRLKSKREKNSKKSPC